MENERDYKGRLLELESQIDSKATLVAVSKYSSVDQIQAFYQLGLKHFAENRVEILLDKEKELSEEGVDKIHWHYIGKLQKNKINKLLSLKSLRYIHSIDSFKLLKELYKREEKIQSSEKINLFLQIKTSGEEEKSGLDTYSEILEACSYALDQKSEKLKLLGLMTMGRIRTSHFELEAKNCFSQLVAYKAQLEIDLSAQLDGEELKLSMGMSQDFPIALEQGADFVRLGRCLFFKS